MKILVYGAGAVGGYLGGKLALAGHDVTLVTRPQTAQMITAEGLLISQSGRQNRVEVRAVGQSADAFDSGQYDLIIMAMKSYDLEAAVAELAALHPQPTQIMCLQNGIGVEEVIARQFDSARIITAVVTIPISRLGPNHVEVETEGRGLGIASVDPGQTVTEWVDLFVAAGIRAEFRDDYRAMKWSKAFLNIMGNASSAILNCPPAEIYRHLQLFDLEIRMLREMLAVMKRSGISYINLPGASGRPLAVSLSFAPRLLLKFVYTQVVIHGRGDKMPSFYMDLAASKGKSEVVFHNGAIAAEGRRFGMATPVNALLNDVLMQLTTGQVDRSEYDHRPERLLAELAFYESAAG